MNPESTAALIAALNNSAAIHTYGEKDETKMNPPPDSIPCTLAGELDSDEEQTAGEASEEPADDMPETDEDAADQQDDDKDSDEPSKSEAEKEQEKKEQEAKDAARWHDYATAGIQNRYLNVSAVEARADAMLAAFKSRFPNA